MTQSDRDLLKRALILELVAFALLMALLPIGLLIGFGAFAPGQSIGPHSIYYPLVWAGHVVVHLLAIGCAFRAFLGETKGRFLGLTSLGVFLLFIGVQSLIPVVARDALIHHLPMLRWWLETGRIIQIPWHEWSYYPAALHLGFLPMAEGVMILYHASFFLIAALVVAALVGREFADKTLSEVSLILALSLPVVVQLSATPLVDGGLVAASACAVVAAWYWSRSGRDIDSLLVGAFLGFAAGVKYNGLLAAAAFGLLIPLLAPVKIGKSRIALLTMIAACVGATLFMPWAVRNEMWTGNPLYPLYRSIFEENLPPALQVGLKPLQYRIAMYGENIVDILLLPLRMVLFGVEGDPRRFDGVVSPILLLSCIAVMFTRGRTITVPLALVSLLYFVVAVSSSAARIRYMAPLFAPMVILTAAGLHQLRAAAPQSRGILTGAVIAIHLAWCVWSIAETIPLRLQWSYLTGAVTPDQYRARLIPDYQCIERVDQEVPSTSKVYMLYTGNYFALFRPQTIGNYQSAHPIARELRRGVTAAGLAAWFRSQGVEHLLISPRRTRDALDALLNDGEKAIWNEFVTGQTTIGWRNERCLFLSIKQSGG